MNKPLTILIADDEVLARKGIRHILNDNPDFEVVGEAVNGQEVIELVQELTPSIVLLDVRMPLKDGLQVLEEIHRLSLPIISIILSGYSDFSYAQKALKYGAFEYLLKPVDPAELVNVLERAKDTFDSKHRRDNEQQKEMLPYTHQALVESFFKGLLTSEFDSKEISRQLEMLNIHETGASVLLLSLDNWYKMKTLSDKEQYSALYNDVRLYLSDYLSDNGLNLPILQMSKEYFVIVLFSSLGIVPSEFALNLKGILAKKINLSFSIAIGSEQTIENLNNSYLSAMSRLKSRLMLGCGAIIDEDYSKSAENKSYPTEYISRLETAIRMKDRNLVQLLLQEMFVKVASSGGLSPESWAQLCLEIIGMGYRIAEEFSIINAVSIIDKVQEISSLTTEDDIRLWINSFIRQITQSVLDSGSQPPAELRKALRYIDEHFGENISLAKLSSYVGLSPNYLGQMIIRHTGKKFTDYILSKRMEKAKLLLNNSSLNISEIALNVGYSNQRYFSQTFIKLEGVTPSEYRQKTHKSKT